jgi:hypothetical protein
MRTGTWNTDEDGDMEHGRGHGNMDEDMERWRRTYPCFHVFDHFSEDTETRTGTWRHKRGHGDMDEDIEEDMKT